MEIDHLFICVQPGAPEAAALTAFGLIEGSGNRHPGQGTANRRFFFANAYLELLWLDNADAAKNELTARTMLFERLSGASHAISPFGVCFRPSTRQETIPTFPIWEYRPEYLPAGLAVGCGLGCLSEPMCFFMSFAARPDAAPLEIRQPMQHQPGFQEITRVRITAPKSDGDYVRATAAAGVEVVAGEDNLIEIGFDHERQLRTRDFRPLLPLLLRW